MLPISPEEKDQLHVVLPIGPDARVCSLTPVRILGGLLFRAIYSGVLPSFQEVNAALNQNDCAGCSHQQGGRIRMSECMRQRITHNFGPALPTAEAFQAFEADQTFLEVGATTGLWSAILQRRGANVLVCAEPLTHRNEWNRKISMTHIAAATMVASCPNHTILMVWPEQAEWPLAVLEAMAPGQRLVAVTEGRYGHCATEDFFDCLSEHFHRDREQSLPQWMGAQDYLHIHVKR